MTLNSDVLDPVFAHLSEGAFGVSIVQKDGRILIERVDPILSTKAVADLIGVSGDTVRRMADRGQLHPIRTRGGMMRFRKSRLVADFSKMEK